MRLILNTTTGEIKEVGNPTGGIGIEIENCIFAEFKFEEDGHTSLALLHPKSSKTDDYDVRVYYFFSDERVEFQDGNNKPIEFEGDSDSLECWADGKINLIKTVIWLENYLGVKFNFPRNVRKIIFKALTFKPVIIG